MGSCQSALSPVSNLGLWLVWLGTERSRLHFCNTPSLKARWCVLGRGGQRLTISHAIGNITSGSVQDMLVTVKLLCNTEQSEPGAGKPGRPGRCTERLGAAPTAAVTHLQRPCPSRKALDMTARAMKVLCHTRKKSAFLS